jgi:hypothetical protein
VDCIFPFEGSLQSMAAAVIGGKADQGLSGSALFRSAALFNHHCSPNLDVNFPHNDGEPERRWNVVEPLELEPLR